MLIFSYCLNVVTETKNPIYDFTKIFGTSCCLWPKVPARHQVANFLLRAISILSFNLTEGNLGASGHLLFSRQGHTESLGPKSFGEGDQWIRVSSV